MLAVDLVYYAIRGERSVAVVTNDDDVWPAVRQTLLLGTIVHHVHPKPGRCTPSHYCSGLGPEYCQTCF